MTPRKPKELNPPDCQIYAGLDASPQMNDHGDLHVVYIGGDYYKESAQIHLSESDVIKLAPWLTKTAAYLKHRRAASRTTKGAK